MIRKLVRKWKHRRKQRKLNKLLLSAELLIAAVELSLEFSKNKKEEGDLQSSMYYNLAAGRFLEKLRRSEFVLQGLAHELKLLEDGFCPHQK